MALFQESLKMPEAEIEGQITQW